MICCLPFPKDPPMSSCEEHQKKSDFLQDPFFCSPGSSRLDLVQGANVLSTKTGIIKLADFGVATKLSEIDSSKRRVVGTPYWMAPETVETLGDGKRGRIGFS